MNLLFSLQSGGGNILLSWGPIILMFAVIWFFFLRPQAKKQKEQSKFVDNIQKGDEVVTASGIIGKVNKIEDNVVTLQVDTKAFIKIYKGSISNEMTQQHLKASE